MGRLAIDVVGAVFLAVGVIADLVGVEVRNEGIAWHWLAIVGVAIIACSGYWRYFDAHRIAHQAEHLIDVTIRPDPVTLMDGEYKWHALSYITDMANHTTYTRVLVDLRNTDIHARTVNNLYLEVCSEKHFWWPFQKRYLTVTPLRVDHQDEWYKRDNPERVDWELPASGPTITHRVWFERRWVVPDDGIPAFKRYQLFLVIEVGGKSHKRRWDAIEEINRQKKRA